jgi:hypothetical protein
LGKRWNGANSTTAGYSLPVKERQLFSFGEIHALRKSHMPSINHKIPELY